MKVGNSHRCALSVPEAIEIQLRLANRVVKKGDLISPRFVAGVDISAKRAAKNARAAVVVMSFPELETAETKTIEGEINFPYVPGLLSFREAPLSVAVCNSLNIVPDVFLIDGQGLAHPRRFGFACHIGLLLDKPTIGCAKSLLLGKYEGLGIQPGSHAEIIDKGEVIGAAVRTRRETKPVYVSIGNKIDLSGSIDMVLKCCRGYRIPEPLRLAHIAAGS
ncbi:MAG: deoxyribonuclease V [Dehalococcoidales bacterium]|nr:deoxyribonuclease V [Dehalococcoidales bacterium]